MNNRETDNLKEQSQILINRVRNVIYRQKEWVESVHHSDKIASELLDELNDLEAILKDSDAQQQTESPVLSTALTAETIDYSETEPLEIHEPEISEEKLVWPETPTVENTKNPFENFEFNLGIKWLSRIGIAALLIGLVMALGYSFPHFTNWMKILTGFVLSVSFFGIGTKLFEKAPILSRILQGGGVSVGYLSLFAMFFIPDVQLFHHMTYAFILLIILK